MKLRRKRRMPLANRLAMVGYAVRDKYDAWIDKPDADEDFLLCFAILWCGALFASCLYIVLR